jgi:hypothetical protein
MARLVSIGFVIVLGVFVASGCNQEPSSSGPRSPKAAARDASTDAIAKAAADFLDAVLQGDSQRISLRLTPQAMQRIVETGEQFNPPGLDKATYRIGEIRTPSRTQAVVRCELNVTSATGATESDEMCCLMRLVDNDWRVCGVASSKREPGQAGMLLDFETGKATPIPSLSAIRHATQPGANGIPATRPSPPRTAQETSALATPVR